MDNIKTRVSSTIDTISNLKKITDEKTAELERIIKESKNLTSLVITSHKKADALERQLEQSERELVERLERLEESIYAAAESRKARDFLEKKLASQDVLLHELELKAEEVRAATILAQNRFNEASQRLREIEDKNEKIDIANDSRLKTVLELEKLCNLYSSKAKSFKSTETSTQETSDLMEKQIKDLSEKIKSATNRAHLAETEAQAKQLELARLEDDLVEWKEQNSSLRFDVERITSEFQEA